MRCIIQNKSPFADHLLAIAYLALLASCFHDVCRSRLLLEIVKRTVLPLSGDLSFLSHPAVSDAQQELEHMKVKGQRALSCGLSEAISPADGCVIALSCWHFDSTEERECSSVRFIFPRLRFFFFLFYSWGILRLCSSTFSLSLACSHQSAVRHMLQHYSPCVLVRLGPYGAAAVATETARKWVHRSTRCLDARAESWCMFVVCFLLTHSLGIKAFKHGNDIFHPFNEFRLKEAVILIIQLISWRCNQ